MATPITERSEFVADPSTDLLFVELGHAWGHHTPVFPGFKDIQIGRVATHAQHGVMSQRIVTVMHHGTHLNAPLHLVPGGLGIGELPLDLFFGDGVVLDVPKGEWELIEPEDLDAAGEVHPGDVVIVTTGWHRHYSDSIEYFGHGPGLSREAAAWLIERGAKLVGIDTATVDHPMATSLAGHKNGPLIKELPRRYVAKTGRQPVDDFPDWNPAHRTLLEAGIPTIENVGGDVSLVAGARCAFQCYPWRWLEGDACVVRLVAILDRTGDYRLEPGN
jgi:kynurenine formamidase